MKNKKVIVILAFMVAAIFAACADEGAPVAAEVAAPTAEVGPLGRFNPGITVTSVRSDVSSSVYDIMLDGDDLENNPWTRAYYNELGIDLTYNWIVPADQFDQRFGLSVAAGDLPDMMRINSMTQLRLLLDSDLIIDLTEVFDQWATPLTQEIVNMDGGFSMRTATFGGRLMAIPETDGMADQTSMIWIRQDWLDALGLDRPTTMTELEDVMGAFVEADFSGRGTFGMAVQNNLLARGNMEVAGFMAGHHAQLDGWILDSSGNLVFGSIQPEMRNAVSHLADLFGRGLIDPEFGVKNATMAAEDISAGRIGVSFGRHWNALFPLNMSKDADSEADWVAIPIVSVDAAPARSLFSNPVPFYNVVTTQAAHPEALVMMVNLWNDKFFNRPDLDHSLYGGDLIHLPPFKTWTPTKNIDARLAVVDALETGDTSGLDPEQSFYYDYISGWIAGSGETLGWSYYRVFGPQGSQAITRDAFENNLYVFNEFYGPPTQTQITRWSVLNDLKLDTFMRIITGAAPIEEFDNFVEQWLSLGGEAVTEEINEWFREVNE